MGKLYEDIVSRNATYRDENDKILSAYDKMLMEMGRSKYQLGKIGDIDIDGIYKEEEKAFIKKYKGLHNDWYEYQGTKGNTRDSVMKGLKKDMDAARGKLVKLDLTTKQIEKELRGHIKLVLTSTGLKLAKIHNKIREDIENIVNESQLNEAKWLDIARKVVKDKQFVYVNPKTLKTVEDKKKGYVVLDMTTANMLVTIADALKKETREKFTSMPLSQAVDIGWKLISK